MSKAKHILVDFSSIRFGGGVQLSLNFLKNFDSSDFSQYKVSALLPGEGEISSFQFESTSNGSVFRAPVNLWSRLWFSHTRLQQLLVEEEIDAIFTFFGPGIPHPLKVPSLVSIAYPIICYPESSFWQHVNLKTRLRQMLINAARCKRLTQGTQLLAETSVMQSRLARQLGCPENKIEVIPPAVSSFFSDSPGTPQEPCRRFLLLSGLAVHKNLWRLYDVALLGHKAGLDFTFVLTAEREAWRKRIRTKLKIDDKIIDQYFEFCGAIPSAEIGSLYKSCDALISLSDLESFSNNYMESWKSGLPLLCSDHDFSRHICGKSALYFDPHDPQSLVREMKRLIGSSTKRTEMIQYGKEKLSELPTFPERYNRIAAILRRMLGE